MKKIFYIIVVISFSLYQPFAQDLGNSKSGPVPKAKYEKSPGTFEKNQNAVTIGYAYASLMQYTLSIPATCGFSLFSPGGPPGYISSMCMGGDGNYYATNHSGPSLYQFDPLNGSFIFLGNISGLLPGELPNGISYNTINGTYYICTSLALYSFDITTRAAQYIGSFNTGGIMIDLCFDANGICYAYDIGVDNAYKINIVTGSVTLLGPLGYDANFGQGMSYDYQTNTIFLSAFNSNTNTGQCRIMNPVTGMTTLISDWGFEQIDAFALAISQVPPCPVGAASNPNPPNGATGLPLTGNTVSWTNGAGTTQVEVWFGEVGNLVQVYSGSAISTFSLAPVEPLSYFTDYGWRIVCKNDTCGTQGPIWSFTTMQDPNLIDDTVHVHPQYINYWTGTCDSVFKTEVSLVEAIGNYVGWMVFDLSSIPDYKVIEEVTFYGYVYSNNWPYWSITPMNSIVPITDSASEIFNHISTHYEQGTAYSYNQEPGTLTNGWLSKDLDNNALVDLQAALPLDYFAIGIVDFDFNPSFFIEFQGWFEQNKPYLVVRGTDCLSGLNPPSNLTAQIIYNPNPQVLLNWQDNSGNEYGFRIYRKAIVPNQQGFYRLVETVSINTTQFLDTIVNPESVYDYRVFAYNTCGSSGSDTVKITIPVPVELISFTGEVDDNVVTLFWRTATETNNQGFEIERAPSKSPPKGETSGWQRIGFVEGKGTTTEIQNYSFTDKPQPGIYKYRLKQIDFDGTFAYSPEVEAEVKAPNVFSLEQNYPNPFNPSTKIKYQIPLGFAASPFTKGGNEGGFVTLKVYDILGNEVATLVNEEQPPGQYEVEFSTESSFRLVRNLTSGIYFYQLKAGSYIETKKMILLK